MQKIHQAGISYRKLGKALNCSESLPRHVNKAAQASALDRISARKGKISTRELARRSNAAQAVRARRAQETLERERNLGSKKISQAICEWLEEEGFPGAYGEQIVDEARRLPACAEEQNELPPHPPAPDGTPVDKIIERFRPQRAADTTMIDIGWYAEWLLRWVYFSLPDSITRHKALGIAPDAQIRGSARPDC